MRATNISSSIIGPFQHTPAETLLLLGPVQYAEKFAVPWAVEFPFNWRLRGQDAGPFPPFDQGRAAGGIGNFGGMRTPAMAVEGVRTSLLAKSRHRRATAVMPGRFSSKPAPKLRRGKLAPTRHGWRRQGG